MENNRVLPSVSVSETLLATFDQSTRCGPMARTTKPETTTVRDHEVVPVDA